MTCIWFSHALSKTMNLLVKTITTASSNYIAASPHHSGTPASSTPIASRGDPVPSLPPRALIFLTSEETRKRLSTVHAMSREAVKVSKKTIGLIDNMIHHSMGTKPKRTKYFLSSVPTSGPSEKLLATTALFPFTLAFIILDSGTSSIFA